MSNDRARKAFEAWAREHGFAGFELRCRDDGSYICTETNDAEAAYAAGHDAGLESAAEVCDAWAVKALAAQSVPPLSDMQNSINSNLRMTSIGPTDCAAVIRALAKGKAPPEGPQ